MSRVLEYIQLACAACRICLYVLCRRICCCISLPAPPRPEYSVICLGLANTGKTSILAVLSGESADTTEPTVGFSIKALQFSSCILNVKEVGGGDKVRPFWKHYYAGSQGIVFVVDTSCELDDMEESKAALSNVLVVPELLTLPCLILANCQDKEGARTADKIKELLELEKHCEGRSWCIQPCSIKNVKLIKEGFEKFNKFLLQTSGDGAKDDVAENRF